MDVTGLMRRSAQYNAHHTAVCSATAASPSRRPGSAACGWRSLTCSDVMPSRPRGSAVERAFAEMNGMGTTGEFFRNPFEPLADRALPG